MMRFTPPTEITPEFVLNYDASCLPNLTPPSETTPEPGEGESMNLVTIPPLEGEFTLLETGTMQESNCTGIEPVGFECMLGEDEVFTYSNPNPDFAFISINNPDGGDIITINHHPDIPNELYIGTSPSWGVVNHDENHYRLASVCYSATHGNRACFWDSLEDDYTMIDLSAGSPMMSPLGTKVLHRRGVGTYLYTIGSSQIPRIYPNHNTSQWSTDTIFYLQYDVYTQYGVPTGEKRIITYPYTGTNSIIVSDNNLQTLFDVNANGDILYWKRIGSDYQLWRYIHSSQTNTPMLPVMPKMSRVHWSPDGTTFILLHETVTNGPACIRWYDLLTATPQTDNYLTIACDIQGQVDWAGNIDLRFMLPQPPTETCLAEIDGTGDFPNGFTVRNIPRDYPSSISIVDRLSPGTAIKILGRNIGLIESGEAYYWWWVDYNGIIGWVRKDGIRRADNGCDIFSFDRVPIVDYVSGTYTEGNMIVNTFPHNPIHDYSLDVPIPPWDSDMPDFEELKNNWDNLTVDVQLDIWHQNSQWSNECTGDDDDRIRENCTLLVFVVFYDLFRRIYPERDLMLSDLLAITYELELKPASTFGQLYNGISGNDISRQALGANYFNITGQYCTDMGYPDCNRDDIPIEHLIHRYTYLNQYNSSVTTSGYLATLQAWYDDAIFINDWYFGTSAEQLDLIHSRDDIQFPSDETGADGAERLRILLAPLEDEIYRTIALLQLNEPRPEYVSQSILGFEEYVVWGNFPYKADGGDIFWQVIQPTATGVKFCVLNLYHPNGRYTPGGEDAFVITTFRGKTDTYENSDTAPWERNQSYLDSFENYKQCSCSELNANNGCEG